jgi:transcriptional regulator with XRE-family HTH domain
MSVGARVIESRDGIRRRELADFLRSRRERTSPVEAGLPERPRRRTPGLRREDLAELAGISATWYTRLEQGRDIRASVSVVERLARALRLDAVERTQLFQLALRQAPPISRGPKEKLSPLIQRVLRNLESMPALVLGRRWDVLGWNLAARALLMDFESVAVEDRNLVWLTFTKPDMRSLFVDWPSRARDVLARFRVDYGRHTGDPQFVDLVNRLKRVSPEFAQWWPRHDLMPHTGGRKHYNHPIAGRLVLEHVPFSINENPELQMLLFTPVPELDSPGKLRRLIEAFAAKSECGVSLNGPAGGIE